MSNEFKIVKREYRYRYCVCLEKVWGTKMRSYEINYGGSYFDNNPSLIVTDIFCLRPKELETALDEQSPYRGGESLDDFKQTH